MHMPAPNVPIVVRLGDVMVCRGRRIYTVLISNSAVPADKGRLRTPCYKRTL